MPNLKDLKNRIAFGQIDPQDHESHANGCRGRNFAARRTLPSSPAPTQSVLTL